MSTVLPDDFPSKFILEQRLLFIYVGGSLVVQRCWVNFQCQGVSLIWIIVGQGPNAPAVVAGGVCLDTLVSSIFSLFFLPL